MLPLAFVERMKKMLGEEFPSFLASYEETKSQALRLNPLKGEGRRFLELSPFSLSPVPWEENGFYFEEADRPGKHPYHEAGVYYIQEASAMVPAMLLDAQPGERILDLCAAPGGKSTQIAAAMRGEGILVCNEIHPKRAGILSENIERMGVRNAIVVNHSPDELAIRFPGYFDRVLVDAPCSGEGMFRKNADACGQWSAENVRLCAGRQDEILDCAAGMLKEGGRLVYSTCTFAPEEDEGSICRFLERHPEFGLEQPVRFPGMECGNPLWCGQESANGEIEKTIRLWPHRLRGEGHFAAVLCKEGEAGDGKKSGKSGQERGIPEKECGEYTDFKRENLRTELPGTLVRFGQRLYLVPEGIFSLKGLKALRPGLHLGTLKTNRFEPAHALALALGKSEVQRYVPLAGEESAQAGMRASALRYLNGETFETGEKGWCLLGVDNYSLGWGKAAGGIMKNHYPRGLRRNW